MALRLSTESLEYSIDESLTGADHLDDVCEVLKVLPGVLLEDRLQSRQVRDLWYRTAFKIVQADTSSI